MKQNQISGKLSLSLILEEDQLTQNSQDIFVAHELLQMKPLWYRGGIYAKYISDNDWAFKFLPNWIGLSSKKIHLQKRSMGNSKVHWFFSLTRQGMELVDFLERIAKRFQLWYSKEKALSFYFSENKQDKLNQYQQKIKSISST